MMNAPLSREPAAPRSTTAAVVLMICNARSGGTLLNRCLGSLPETLVLSEVNALGGGWGALGPDSPTTVQEQARDWYGIKLECEDFVDAIIEMADRCQSQSSHLVVRDWTFVNFFSHPYNGGEPSMRLETMLSLEARCQLRPFALVRNPIDVWLSRGKPSVAEFTTGMSAYAQALVDHDVTCFQYERFCSRPEQEMKAICDFTSLSFSTAFRRYRGFKTVHGDTQKGARSRGVRQGRIAPLARKPIADKELKALLSQPNLRRAAEQMGYSWPEA